MRIIFFGSTDVSLKFLSFLAKTEDLAAVITQSDKPAGRGQKLHSTPVKDFAETQKIKCLTPLKLKEQSFLGIIENLKPDLGFVVSYGRIIPKELLSMFRFGCINVHFSLLPKYRGAAPIQWALINGEQETGVTLFLIDEGLDTGRYFLQRKVKIEVIDDVISLQGKLVSVGIDAALETLDMIKKAGLSGIENMLALTRQQEGVSSLAPPLEKAACRIEWKKNSREIHDLVRGLVPWPVACAGIKGKFIKIFESEIVENYAESAAGFPAGAVAGVEKEKGIIVKCGKGFLLIKQLQAENREKMNAWKFWQGARLKVGDIFD